MKLTLDREDLKPEYANVNCSQIRFVYFHEEVQAAILAIGRAVFREYDGSNYNAIYPPKEGSFVKGHLELIEVYDDNEVEEVALGEYKLKGE